MSVAYVQCGVVGYAVGSRKFRLLSSMSGQAVYYTLYLRSPNTDTSTIAWLEESRHVKEV